MDDLLKTIQLKTTNLVNKKLLKIAKYLIKNKIGFDKNIIINEMICPTEKDLYIFEKNIIPVQQKKQAQKLKKEEPMPIPKKEEEEPKEPKEEEPKEPKEEEPPAEQEEKDDYKEIDNVENDIIKKEKKEKTKKIDEDQIDKKEKEKIIQPVSKIMYDNQFYFRIKDGNEIWSKEGEYIGDYDEETEDIIFFEN